MRKNILKTLKPSLAIVLLVALLFAYLPANIASAFIDSFSSTQVFHQEEREVAKGVILNRWVGTNSNGTNKVGQTITFHPSTSDAMIYATYGNSVNSRTTLSNLSKIEEQRQGVSVIGGINGDFYYVDSGIPIGLLIQNGRLISHSDSAWSAVGFKDDGTVIIDVPSIKMNLITNGQVYGLGNLNKPHKPTNDWGPYLYSRDFGVNTGTTVPSLEIVLDIIEGDLKVGDTVTAIVSEIRMDAQSTPIGPNQLVLSAMNGKSGYNLLASFRMNQEVLFEFKDADNKWRNVNHAVGGDKILINNGAIVSGLSASDYAPSTAVGVKANGEVVLYQVDGRSTASQGVSSAETAQFLYKLGCVKALKLDGGGSSSIITRMPGNSSPRLLNNPSDGVERANSNGLILFSKQSEAIKEGTAIKSEVPSKLHIYPRMAYTLPGTNMKLSVLATDEYFLPTGLPASIEWVTGTGTIDNNGNLKVGENPGRYHIMAFSDTIIEGGAIEVLKEVTSIKPSKTSVVMLPGDKIDLSCEAYYRGIKVNSSTNSFNWQVEGDIGTITQDGVFTLTKSSIDTGRIAVSYGNKVAYINVVIPSSNLHTIEDFEGNMGWGYSTVRANSANVAIVQDANLARSGKGLLKLDYDFTLESGVQSGVAGVYAYMIAPNSNTKIQTPVSGNPSAIGMWVYGDNSKTWLRSSVKDGNGQSFYIDFTSDYNPSNGTGGINWTGWNYVEAKIPQNRKGPFTLETPIRVMCSRDNMRTKGTLYFDQIRPIYGEGASILNTTAKITSPNDGGILSSGRVIFAAEIIKGENVTGIDIKSIKATIDNLPIENLSIEGAGNIIIKGELGADLPLADGYHTILLEYADLMGNKGTESIDFTVKTGSPSVTATTDSTVMKGGTFNTVIEIDNPKNLKKVYLDFRYDKSMVSPVDQDGKTSGIQAALEPWAQKGKIISHRVDEEGGRVVMEIDNLTNIVTSDKVKLATITFKANEAMKDSSAIKLGVGALIKEGNPRGQRFDLPNMGVSIDYPLVINAEGLNKGDIATITVTDKAGNPVADAGIHINDIAYVFWKTDAKGQVKSNIISLAKEEGKPFSIRAKKGELISEELVIVE